ncbi:hypothetical protein BN7_4887 [Wickerhamomyces ciferrii]|uniref:Altered inheritance of mitochondria protein 1 n=1 Tax=Wickerhamomyces ciferrii (strain ATCC 14091 / BCRC 22168 / CBS 111 / JCM 3599 / NBRC 0793 / NRRL Y-1031 F-60-10) TaxID=1206466 RepID=K0KJA6_WICCF|nr:uncharacterized protein BN7_4887 [Wickerhamomyces ciferrii]CCH45305.1 hypothetical protein BN7_4887 [Wickerhamomyces ciferrii]
MFRLRSLQSSLAPLRSSTLTRPVILKPSIISTRFYSEERLSDYEQLIYNKLYKELTPESLEVMDISGGCGSMFAISVVSQNFKGLTMIKQHKLVNSILSDEIAKWHGLQLKTKAPK